ncbi:hypothetical protein HOP50_13g69030 [Chloropicon primus]|uniref:Uncharacterized protein n=1 Tax=Chloropicon primus TaxID=1764295 RepID=A0A5B8MXE1_9CHLO|nr:hypothetical protein A3770_13p68830 [Chloropicon primus]UPR03573.1 hypothetical protein HOP50_13g69030 [Chloropicon primus]|eukprot:QDZ24365.1 hypothetical protein A3770_13p68830 [Chloropicon primus]
MTSHTGVTLEGDDITKVLSKLEANLKAKAEENGDKNKSPSPETKKKEGSPGEGSPKKFTTFTTKLRQTPQVEAEEVFDDFIDNLPLAKKYLLRIEGRLPWEQQANKGNATEEEAAFHRIHMLHTQLHTLCTNSKQAADFIGQRVRDLPKSTIDTLLSLLDQLNDFNLSDYIRLLVYCADKTKKKGRKSRPETREEKVEQERMIRFTRLRRESIRRSVNLRAKQTENMPLEKFVNVMTRARGHSINSHPYTPPSRPVSPNKKKKDRIKRLKTPPAGSGFFSTSSADLVRDSLLFVQNERDLNHTPLPTGNTLKDRFRTAGAAIAGFFNLDMEEADENENVQRVSTPERLGINLDDHEALQMYSDQCIKSGISRHPKVLFQLAGEALELEGCHLGRKGMLPIIETLKQSSTLKLRRINFVDNHVTPSLCAMLVSVLTTNHDLFVNHLDLSFNKISDAGCGSIANMIALADRDPDDELHSLFLVSCDIGPKSLSRLFYSLSDNFNLQTLDISKNVLDKQAAGLLGSSLLTNTTLVSLTMQEVGLNVAHIQKMKEGLAKSKSLTYLDLSQNLGVGSPGAVLICEALLDNDKVELVNLCKCQIDSKAGPTLADLVMLSKSLEDLNLSYNMLGETAVLALNLAAQRQRFGTEVSVHLYDCSSPKKYPDGKSTSRRTLSP